MKIKLVQAGYQNLTGTFGNVLFDNGVSEDLRPEIAATFNALVQCEEFSESKTVAVSASKKSMKRESAAANEIPPKETAETSEKTPV
jgi:hypothetical protein